MMRKLGKIEIFKRRTKKNMKIWKFYNVSNLGPAILYLLWTTYFE